MCVKLGEDIYTGLDIGKNWKDNAIVNNFFRSRRIPDTGADFKYLGEYQSLEVDAWRSRQPNAKIGDQCIASYFSLEPTESWYKSCIFSNA